MLYRGFRRVQSAQDVLSIDLLNLDEKAKHGGFEVGFVFRNNGLKVYVWTTWIYEFEEARKSDAGWVLITDKKGNTLYFAHPFHRTKNFVDTVVRYARVAKYKIEHRPLCTECNRFLDIVQGRAIKSRYWKCDHVAEHRDGKPVNLNWDYGLPEIARQYLQAHRKKRAADKLRREAKGIIVKTPAVITRFNAKMKQKLKTK